MNQAIATASPAEPSVFAASDLTALDRQADVSDDILPIEPGSTPGVEPGSFSLEMPNEAYHSRRAFISHTGMIELLRSPAHYFEYLIRPREESAPNVYSVIHCAALEPEVFDQQYVVYDGTRRGKAWTQFKADNADRQIITASEAEMVTGVVEALRNFEDFPLWDALRAGEAEKSIFWTDRRSGARCRIRTDNLTPHVIFDLKGIDDARQEKVQAQIARMDYDLQAYMYSEGVRAFTGQFLPFWFVFVESKRPHGISMVRAGQSVLANGFIKFRRGTQRFAKLCADGNWGGYSNAIYTAELPRYAMLTPENDSELLSEDV